MKTIALIFFFSILSPMATAFDCPESSSGVFQEAKWEDNITSIISSERAYIVFTNDVLILPDQSSAWVGNVVITDLSGVHPYSRTIAKNQLRQLLTYDWGHTPGPTYYAYTSKLRVHFQGSRFYRTYEDLLERGEGKVRICLKQ